MLILCTLVYFKVVGAITVNLFKKPVFLQASDYLAPLQPFLCFSFQQCLFQLKGTTVATCKSINLTP